MKKLLIIQTAFIGDVVLATSLAEKLHQHYPAAKIDFLVRKGNEGLLVNHPFIHDVLIWNKKNQKTKNLIQALKQIRANKYDLVVNAQRFFSTGFLTAFSRAKKTVGFDKNPLSFLFSEKIVHEFGIQGREQHEVERNQKLIASITDQEFAKPKLYPSPTDLKTIKKQGIAESYVCMAPTSVWFTKQLPKEKWVELTNKLSDVETIFLLGGPGDKIACEAIAKASDHPDVQNKAGSFSFLESAALMKGAKMNYVNDSAPLHFASAVNAPVTAFFCSTIPAFGFTPLSDISVVLEVEKKLNCRPCGMHGKKTCPLGHFDCGKIEIGKLVK